MNVIECIDLCKIYERKPPSIRIERTEKVNKIIQTVALDKINFTVKKRRIYYNNGAFWFWKKYSIKYYFHNRYSYKR